MDTTTVDTVQQVQQEIVYRWPSINDTVPWVALVIGFVVFLIAYFAAGRVQNRKITFAILFCVVLGGLCMPVFEKFENLLCGFLSERTSWIITMMLFMAYISAVAINLYDVLIVTAREAHPMS